MPSGEVSFPIPETPKQSLYAKHIGGEPPVRDAVEKMAEGRDVRTLRVLFNLQFHNIWPGKAALQTMEGSQENKEASQRMGEVPKSHADEARKAGAHEGLWEHTSSSWERPEKQSIRA